MKEGLFRIVLEAALLPALACSIFAQEVPADTGGELVGTSWDLVKFQGGDEKTLTPEDKSKYNNGFREGQRQRPDRLQSRDAVPYGFVRAHD